MRELRFTSRFQSDFRQLCKQRALTEADFLDLEHLLGLLSDGAPLPAYYREHWLDEGYAGYLECHLDGDWLVIYKAADEVVVLHRTGSHRSLFPRSGRLRR